MHRLPGPVVMHPQAIIAAVAAEYVGLRETSRNRGPKLEEFWKAAGYNEGEEDRAPWCSAFVCWCIQEADRRSPWIGLRVPPRFPGVRQWLPWARRPDIGCMVFRAGVGITPRAGDVLVMLPELSHIGIVAAFDGASKVVTIEGNTGASGEREGDGVWKKVRAVTFGTFIRIPAVPELQLGPERRLVA